MKFRKIQAMLTIGVLSFVAGTLVLAAQDKFTLKAANGIAFSEFEGYDAWQSVAPSQPDDGLKLITANAVMINAYKAGFPGNGMPVPDGAMMAKIEWGKKKNPESPYPVLIPDTLKRVGLIVKDSKRFSDTDGWGYAQFVYDAASNSFRPEESDPSFGKKLCHSCHTRVKAKDFVFTGYPLR